MQIDGTPGETRTHYLALRRRTLYPGELRRHNCPISGLYILTKKSYSVKKIRHIFCKHKHILLCSLFERRTHMVETSDPNADLEDLIFYPNDGGPSER